MLHRDELSGFCCLFEAVRIAQDVLGSRDSLGWKGTGQVFREGLLTWACVVWSFLRIRWRVLDLGEGHHRGTGPLGASCQG